MSNQVEFFVHRDGHRPEVCRCSSDETVTALLQRVGLDTGTEVEVSVAQSVESLDDDADDELDLQNPLPDTQLATLGVKNGTHIFCHRCRTAKVRVNYQCDSAERSFRPRATIRRVERWARREFHLTDQDAQGLFLRVCEQQVGARPTQHLGEFIHAPNCDVCFDLVPDPKING